MPLHLANALGLFFSIQLRLIVKYYRASLASRLLPPADGSVLLYSQFSKQSVIWFILHLVYPPPWWTVPVGGSCSDTTCACAHFFHFFMRILLRVGQKHVLVWLPALTTFSCPGITSASLQQVRLPSLGILVAECFPAALQDPSGSTATLVLCVLGRWKCHMVGLACVTSSDCWARSLSPLGREWGRKGLCRGNMGKQRHEEGRKGSRPDLGVVVEPGVDPRLLALLQARFLGRIAGILLFLLVCYFLIKVSYKSAILANRCCYRSPFYCFVFPLCKASASLFCSSYVKPSQFSMTFKNQLLDKLEVTPSLSVLM